MRGNGLSPSQMMSECNDWCFIDKDRQENGQHKKIVFEIDIENHYHYYLSSKTRHL